MVMGSIPGDGAANSTKIFLLFRDLHKHSGYTSTLLTGQGNIHVLRNHKGGREEDSQMLMFAYVGGGQGG